MRCEQVCHQSLAEADARFGKDTALVVGLSGGMDSCVLLLLCHRYAPGRTRALHVNHGYSSASADWQRHCEQLCSQLGVPLQVCALEAGGARLREAAARAGRYRIFAEQLAADEILLLAHHRDDHAETLLLHLLQGRGTYAMPKSRVLGRTHLWRPLLELDRSVLVDYARDHDLSWLDDDSNEDLRHDRNFLRHQILPQLAQRFAPLPLRLTQAAQHLASLEQLLTDQLRLDRAELELTSIAGLAPAQQLTIVRLWLGARGIAQPARKALENFLAQLQQPEDRQPQLTVTGGSLRRYRRRVWFVPDLQPDTRSRPIHGVGQVIVPQGRLLVDADPNGVYPAGQLRLRFWQAPDEAGAASATSVIRTGGQHHRVKELLRTANVAPWRRTGYPLLEDDQGLLCVPGVALRDGVERGTGGYRFAWQAK
jgi:tRNA(Ile)-lysidine synthase